MISVTIRRPGWGGGGQNVTNARAGGNSPRKLRPGLLTPKVAMLCRISVERDQVLLEGRSHWNRDPSKFQQRAYVNRGLALSELKSWDWHKGVFLGFGRVRCLSQTELWRRDGNPRAFERLWRLRQASAVPKNNINNFSGVSRERVVLKLFMCCFFLGKSETHERNPKNLRRRPLGKGRDSCGTIP